jgi:hypothetical protein
MKEVANAQTFAAKQKEADEAVQALLAELEAEEAESGRKKKGKGRKGDKKKGGASEGGLSRHGEKKKEEEHEHGSIQQEEEESAAAMSGMTLAEGLGRDEDQGKPSRISKGQAAAEDELLT